MTTYGTIPTSSSPPTNQEFNSRANERTISVIGARRPWKLMFNFRSFSLPNGFRDALLRIKTNLVYFQMNYDLLVLLIFFVSILWHPIPQIVFDIFVAAFGFFYMLSDKSIVVFGCVISYCLILELFVKLTFVLLLLTSAILNFLTALLLLGGALLNFLLVFLVGWVLVLVHAAFRNTNDLSLDEEQGFSFSPPGAPAS